MNPTVPENSYMSAYRKQVIKRQMVNSCSFCVVSVAPFSTSLYLFLFVCLFVFVALRPMSTAMAIAGRSVHLTTLFPGQA